MNFLDLEREIIHGYDIEYFMEQSLDEFYNQLGNNKSELHSNVKGLIRENEDIRNMMIDYYGSEFHFDMKDYSGPTLRVNFYVCYNTEENIRGIYYCEFDGTGFVVGTTVKITKSV